MKVINIMDALRRSLAEHSNKAVPSLTPDKVNAVIMVNGDCNYFPANKQRHGRWDCLQGGHRISGHLQKTRRSAGEWGSVPSGTAMSPIAPYDPTTGNTTPVVDQTALSGKTGSWSAPSVYGARAFDTSNTGSAAVWGSTALWARAIPTPTPPCGARLRLWGKGTPDVQTALWVKSRDGVASVALTY